MTSTAEQFVAQILFASANSDQISCVDKFLEDEAIALLSSDISSLDKQRLILRGNCIGDRGARALSDMLRSNKYLTYLELNWNQITCSGATEIAASLRMNLSLLHLDLRNNHIQDGGAIALAGALKVNETLRYLDLRWNQIGDEGAVHFKDSINTRRTPLVIHLAGNLLSQKMQSMVLDWARVVSSQEVTEEGDEYELNPPKVSSNLVMELECRKSIVEKDSKQLREEVVVLQELVSELQQQLDCSATEIAKLEQTSHRDKFNEAQLKEALRGNKARVIELSEEKRLLTDMWDRERSETLEKIRELIADRESQTMVILSERDALADKVKRLMDDKANLEQQVKTQHALFISCPDSSYLSLQVDILLHQTSSAKSKHESDVRNIELELSESVALNASLRSEIQSLKEHLDFAEKGKKAKEEELVNLRVSDGNTAPVNHLNHFSNRSNLI